MAREKSGNQICNLQSATLYSQRGEYGIPDIPDGSVSISIVATGLSSGLFEHSAPLARCLIDLLGPKLVLFGSLVGSLLCRGNKVRQARHRAILDRRGRFAQNLGPPRQPALSTASSSSTSASSPYLSLNKFNKATISVPISAVKRLPWRLPPPISTMSPKRAIYAYCWPINSTVNQLSRRFPRYCVIAVQTLPESVF